MSDPAPHPRFPEDEESGPAGLPARIAAPAVPAHPPAPLAGPAAPVPAPPVPAQREADGFALAIAAEELGRGRRIPVLGTLSAIFGIAALFKAPLALGPLAVAFGVAALFRRQAALGAIGGVAGLVGLLISPLFWGLIGVTWAGSWLWSWMSG